MIKYQVYDGTTGETKRFDTKDDAMNAFTQMVVELAMKYSLGCPYTKVEINDDGSETYFSDTEVIWSDWLNTAEVQKIINQLRSGN